MSSSQCDLCLAKQKELILFKRQTREITLRKLFSGIVRIEKIAQICKRCDRSIIDCCKFYKRVKRAIEVLQHNNSDIVSESIERITKYESDSCSDVPDYEGNDFVKEEIEDPLCKDEMEVKYDTIVNSNNKLIHDISKGDEITQEFTDATNELLWGNSPTHSSCLISIDNNVENDHKQSEENVQIQKEQCVDKVKIYDGCNSILENYLTRRITRRNGSSNKETKKKTALNNLDRKERKIKLEKEQDIEKEEFENTVDKKRIEKKIQRRKKLNSFKSKDHIPAQICLNFDDFPKEILKGHKLAIRGLELDVLLDKFYDLTCKMCTEEHGSIPVYETMTDLFSHYESAHKTRGFIKCCDRKFIKKQTIVYHMASHVQPSLFQCPYCSYFSSTPLNLRSHIQHHLPESERTLFKCDQCSKSYVELSRLRIHKMSHLPIEQRKIYNCKFCDKTFTQPTSVSVHVNLEHKGRRFLCSDCGKSFREKANYEHHLKSVHNPSALDKAQCTICSVVVNRTNLNKHMKRHGEPTHFCTLCDFKTFEKGILNQHMKKHSHEKRFVCVICDKRFTLKMSMLSHMAQHTGEKKYSCSFCPRTFVNASNRYSHQKKMHEAELKRRNELKRQKLLMQCNKSVANFENDALNIT